MMIKGYYTVAECAEYLGRSDRWVRNMIKSSRDFPRCRVGHKWLIPKARLEHWIDSTGVDLR